MVLTMCLSKEKINLLIGLAVLTVSFALIRLKTLGHLLMWDEAWNILSLRAFIAEAVRDPFYWYYRFHPPLYMFFAKFLNPFGDNFAVRAEALSLVFSYGTFITVYFLSYRIGGWRYAWLSGLILCFMPISIGYDSWVKRDSLAMFMGYLSLLLVVDKRFLLSAIALGLSFLSKESALFFSLPVAFMIFTTGGKKKTRIFVMFLLIIALMTAWWYIPLSNLTKNVNAFYLSEDYYGKIWLHSPLYYIKKLVPDIGIGGILLFIVGLIFLPYFSRIKRRAEISLPVIIFFCVYVPISLVIATKTPWLSYSAAPALAMIAGGGALFIFGRTYFSRIMRSLLFLILAFIVFTGVTFSYPVYHMKTYPNGWPGAQSSWKLAEYLNEHMKDDDRLMITDFAYWRMPTCPVFIYYWKPHEIMIIKGTQTAATILKRMKKHKISWFVVADSPDPAYNYHALVKKMEVLLPNKPTPVGWSYVWNVSNILSDEPSEKTPAEFLPAI
jgi:4-amino-4-deoxy-L-arabinose transferase-like glycosyltransferase